MQHAMTAHERCVYKRVTPAADDDAMLMHAHIMPAAAIMPFSRRFSI